MYSRETARNTSDTGLAWRVMFWVVAAAIAMALIAPQQASAATAQISIRAEIAPKVSVRLTDGGVSVRANVVWRLQLMDAFGQITVVEGLPTMDTRVDTAGAQVLTVVAP